MKRIRNTFVGASLAHPWRVIALTLLVVVALGAMLPRLHVDTDPENMLPFDDPARALHRLTKADFSLYDMLVVGIVNEDHPDGVFNAASLAHIHDLTRRLEQTDGVIARDLMSLASVDNITQGGPGVVRFAWLMREAPRTDAEARAVRDAARRLPVIDGTLVSEDGRAAAIYVPLRRKSDSHRIASEIERIASQWDGGDRVYITGLPVAEETFGVEMFRQMAVAAPMAGLIIFLLMLFFFRSLSLVTAPMVVAVLTVTATMGALVGMGYTVHIMSSMIPIFLMPIAVVDSIHILSEFSDLYPTVRDRRKTIRLVMADLFQPMLYTSLTSAAGFASLMLTPIPPVRVFGGFVAFGIMLAWVMTVTFVPAWVALMSDRQVERLGRVRTKHEHHRLARWLEALGPATLVRWKSVVAITVIVMAVSAWGISHIRINDNPVRWFRSHHRIRVADRVLNEHFAGTYNAFLVLTREGTSGPAVRRAAAGALADAPATVRSRFDALLADATRGDTLDTDALIASVEREWEEAADDASADAWSAVLDALEGASGASRAFQDPAMLGWIESLQADLAASGRVGKSVSIADVVKTVHRELREGRAEFYRLPDTREGIAQTLLNYQSSHRPHDLWHFVTPDYRKANVWLQLRSGDNRDMAAVERRVRDFVAAHPLPEGTRLDWAGLTYLNVVWQDKMVRGMLESLAGSFVVVLAMMLVLFRSVTFGLLAMLPLSVTIAFVYGLVGIFGKDYDMPIAVLSSLTLGLSVDFAIHFLERIRAVCHETRRWRETVGQMFREPARAISRNAIVIAVGFLPLLASPLVPYNTVGIFLALIMTASAAVTLVLLPAILHPIRMRAFRGHLPPDQEHELVTEAGRRTLRNVAVATVAAATVVAAAPTARADVADVVRRANHAAFYAGDDGRARARMVITDARGRRRIRQFTMLRRDVTDGGDQFYLVVFSRPADVRGTVFLVRKHVGRDDDRWLYLPGLDLVKRIAAGDRRTSFVGSHFVYEDVSGRDPSEDTHELVAEDDTTWVLRNVPREPGSVEFASWRVWVDKRTNLPMRAEYVDASGTVYRRMEVLEVKTIDGHPTATRMRMSDLRNGGHTVITFRNVAYDVGIPEDVFTERSLRNPPRALLGGRRSR